LIADSSNGRILDNVFRPTNFTMRWTTQSVVGRKLRLPGRPDEPLTAMWACQAHFFRFRAIPKCLICPLNRAIDTACVDYSPITMDFRPDGAAQHTAKGFIRNRICGACRHVDA